MSAPTIPQRPARSHAPPITSTAPVDSPIVPPRPARHVERSVSPTRESYTRSPLNDSPFASQKPSMDTLLHEKESSNRLYRMPSVSQLPLVGQEGMEYASLDEGGSSPEQEYKRLGHPTHTRNVAGDLPLHAPKAAVAPATARSQIATVTRTDSSPTAGVGVGKLHQDYEEPDSPMLRHTISRGAERRISGHYSPDISRSASRPASIYGLEHDHGIPEIGLQVPMYPNAGDVQAPSPGPSALPSTGIGFFNNPSRTSISSSSRRKSTQGGPPGSYGLHGHGAIQQHDNFEKSWYQKHPDEFAKEKQGAYGPGLGVQRGEWAMSSEELNKLVRESTRGLGFGTSPAVISTPSEDMGFLATEEYTSRMSSPHIGALHLTKSHSRSHSGALAHVNSPLRKANTPGDADHHALESELDEDTMHLEPPNERHSKIHGGGYDPPTADLGPRGGNTDEHGGWIDERGTGTPILASDEISKDPASEYMHAAISPPLDKDGDDHYFAPNDPNAPYQSSVRDRSRSRPRTSRFQEPPRTGTPLEQVEEYEPLFEDEDEGEAKAITAADRFKQRPDFDHKHRFPSQDIWEDTPTSLQYTTTVETPQEFETAPTPTEAKAPVSSTFELPEKEAARKGEIIESERLSFLTDPSKGYAKPKFSTAVQQDMIRPGLRHRFPSQDIWEDTPDSLRLETTVDPDTTSDATSPVVRSPTTGEKIQPMNALAQSMEAVDPALTGPLTKPTVPTRPARGQASEADPATVPLIPSRPPQRQNELSQIGAQAVASTPSERKTAPDLPDRPRPHVPPRPAQKPMHESAVEALPAPISITKTSARDSTDDDVLSTSPTKSKPAVPSKPTVGGKFAALKAGFMSDLNSRLQLGPPAPPKPQPEAEPEEEKAPLSDARKGRARGPARRQPATTSEPLTSTSSVKLGLHFVFSEPNHIWSIDPASPRTITIGQGQQAAPQLASTTKTATELSQTPTVSPLARNTAGESLPAISDTAAPKTLSGPLAHACNAEMDARARAEEVQKQEEVRAYTESTIGHLGDMPEPVIDQPLKEFGGTQGTQPMGAQGVIGTEALSRASEGGKLDMVTSPHKSNITSAGGDGVADVTDEHVVSGDALVGEMPNETQITAEAEAAMPGGFPVTE